jgi:hypothetical protein
MVHGEYVHRWIEGWKDAFLQQERDLVRTSDDSYLN